MYGVALLLILGNKSFMDVFDGCFHKIYFLCCLFAFYVDGFFDILINLRIVLKCQNMWIHKASWDC